MEYIVHFVLSYQPKIFSNTINTRNNCSLLYIEKGSYLYTFQNGTVTGSDGDVIYIPKGSSYTYSVLPKSQTYCIQIEFSIINSKTKDWLALADHPVLLPKIEHNIIQQCFSNILLLHNAQEKYYNLGIKAYMLLLMYHWFSQNDKLSSFANNKIQAAISYIHQNFTKKIYVNELAKLCLMSKSQLWRLFIDTVGASPIEYKNRLLFDKACSLLSDSNISISEIANSLGFDSPYAFSQMFKKRFGISPTNYRKKNKQLTP